MPNYRYILFDWDGTLVQSYAAWEQAYAETYLEYGIQLTSQQITSRAFNGETAALEFGIQQSQMKDFIQQLFVKTDQYLHDVQPYPHAIELLQQLHQQECKLAVVTSSPQQLINQRLTEFNIAHLFAATITADDVTNLKPDPEPIQKAIQALNANPAETLMVGDTVHDLDAANNASIDSILFYPKDHEHIYSLEDLKKSHPTHIVRSLEEVIEMFRNTEE